METNTPFHCMHGVLEGCCRICDSGKEECPSCAAKDARIKRLQSQPCAAREAVRSKVIDALNRHQAPMEACQDVVDSIDAALSSSSSSSAPCPHAVELEEGDYWMECANKSFANGMCPCCFCTDEGPHEKGCGWVENAAIAARAQDMEGMAGFLWKEDAVHEMGDAKKLARAIAAWIKEGK